LIVLDVDDATLAAELEEQFPLMKTTAIQKTRTGFHYFFKRSAACDMVKIWDKARCLGDLPIDVKTVCSTGTGGLISIWPSPGKEWVHPLYECPPIELPAELFEFIRSRYKAGKNAREPKSDAVWQPSVAGHDSVSERASESTDVALAKRLMECLSVKRVSDYSTWIAVGICLRCIDDGLLPTWIDWSKKSANFGGEYVCCEKWRTFVGAIGIEALCAWAKQDNHGLYTCIMDSSIEEAQRNVFDAPKGTHTALARLMYLMYRGVYVCSSIGNDTWWHFENGRWHSMDSAWKLRHNMSHEVYVSLLKVAQQRVGGGRLSAVEEEKWQGVISELHNLQKVQFKEKLKKECAEFFYDRNFVSKLDTQVNLIGFENGVYDLDEKVFREGRPEDYMTMSVGYDYTEQVDEAIRADIFAFINSIQPTGEMAQYLLKVMAYMICGNKYLEFLWFLTGLGRNGKGVLCTLTDATLGDYAYQPKPEIFTNAMKGTGPNPEIAQMKGKRCIMSSEPDDTDASAFKVNRLKQWRGNDKIQARGMYENAFTFQPQFGILISMNDMPKLDKVDEAIACTLKVIDFPFKFTNNPQGPFEKPMDSGLKLRFEQLAYRQQFMLILIEYYHKYIHGNQPLEDACEVKEATQAYMTENNALGDWLARRVDVTGMDSDRISTTALRQMYEREEGKHIDATVFGKALNYNKLKKQKCGGIMYVMGVKCRAVEDDVDELAVPSRCL
jgi:P4 family phage/plasmid primase-like protien